MSEGKDSSNQSEQGEQPRKTGTLPPPAWNGPRSVAGAHQAEAAEILALQRHRGLSAPIASLQLAIREAARDQLPQIHREKSRELFNLYDGLSLRLPQAARLGRRLLLEEDNAELRLELIHLYGQAGRLREVIATLRPLLSSVAASSVWIQLGSISARLGDFETAIEDLGEAVKLSRDPLPHTLLSHVLASAERKDAAAFACQSAADLSSDLAVRVQHLRRAFELDPAGGPWTDEVAAQFFQKEEYFRADQVLKKRLNLLLDGAEREKHYRSRASLFSSAGANLHVYALLDWWLTEGSSADEDFWDSDLPFALDAAGWQSLELSRCLIELSAGPRDPRNWWAFGIQLLTYGREALASAAYLAALECEPRYLPAIDALESLAKLRGALRWAWWLIADCLRHLDAPLEHRLSTVQQLRERAEEASDHSMINELELLARALRDTSSRSSLYHEAELESSGVLRAQELLAPYELAIGDVAVSVVGATRVGDRLYDLRAALGAADSSWIDSLARALASSIFLGDALKNLFELTNQLGVNLPADIAWLGQVSDARHGTQEQLGLKEVVAKLARINAGGEKTSPAFNIRICREIGNWDPLLEALPVAMALRARRREWIVPAGKIYHELAGARLPESFAVWLAQESLDAGDISYALTLANYAVSRGERFPGALKIIALHIDDVDTARDTSEELARLGLLSPELCERNYQISFEAELFGSARLWAQRWLILVPHEASAQQALLNAAVHEGKSDVLSGAIHWTLGQLARSEKVQEYLAQALLALVELDPSQADSLFRRTIELFGCHIPGASAIVRRLGDSQAELAWWWAEISAFHASGSGARNQLEAASAASRAGKGLAVLVNLYDACQALKNSDETEISLSEIAELFANSPKSAGGDGTLLRLEIQCILEELSQSPNWLDSKRQLAAARWDILDDRGGALDLLFEVAKESQQVERWFNDVLELAGPTHCFSWLARYLRRLPLGESARWYARMAQAALTAKEEKSAAALAWAAIERDPRRGEVLNVLERTIGKADLSRLERAYQRVADASLGNFGLRAVHYRAARYLEKAGATDMAFHHAVEAFRAVPAAGVSMVQLIRLATSEVNARRAVVVLESAAELCAEPARSKLLFHAANLHAGGSGSDNTRAMILWRAFESDRAPLRLLDYAQHVLDSHENLEQDYHERLMVQLHSLPQDLRFIELAGAAGMLDVAVFVQQKLAQDTLCYELLRTIRQLSTLNMTPAMFDYASHALAGASELCREELEQIRGLFDDAAEEARHSKVLSERPTIESVASAIESLVRYWNYRGSETERPETPAQQVEYLLAHGDEDSILIAADAILAYGGDNPESWEAPLLDAALKVKAPPNTMLGILRRRTRLAEVGGDESRVVELWAQALKMCSNDADCLEALLRGIDSIPARSRLEVLERLLKLDDSSERIRNVRLRRAKILSQDLADIEAAIRELEKAARDGEPDSRIFSELAYLCEQKLAWRKAADAWARCAELCDDKTEKVHYTERAAEGFLRAGALSAARQISQELPAAWWSSRLARINLDVERSAGNPRAIAQSLERLAPLSDAGLDERCGFYLEAIEHHLKASLYSDAIRVFEKLDELSNGIYWRSPRFWIVGFRVKRQLSVSGAKAFVRFFDGELPSQGLNPDAAALYVEASRIVNGPARSLELGVDPEVSNHPFALLSCARAYRSLSRIGEALSAFDNFFAASADVWFKLAPCYLEAAKLAVEIGDTNRANSWLREAAKDSEQVDAVETLELELKEVLNQAAQPFLLERPARPSMMMRAMVADVGQAILTHQGKTASLKSLVDVVESPARPSLLPIDARPTSAPPAPALSEPSASPSKDVTSDDIAMDRRPSLYPAISSLEGSAQSGRTLHSMLPPDARLTAPPPPSRMEIGGDGSLEELGPETPRSGRPSPFPAIGPSSRPSMPSRSDSEPLPLSRRSQSSGAMAAYRVPLSSAPGPTSISSDSLHSVDEEVDGARRPSLIPESTTASPSIRPALPREDERVGDPQLWEAMLQGELDVAWDLLEQLREERHLSTRYHLLRWLRWQLPTNYKLIKELQDAAIASHEVEHAAALGRFLAPRWSRPRVEGGLLSAGEVNRLVRSLVWEKRRTPAAQLLAIIGANSEVLFTHKLQSAPRSNHLIHDALAPVVLALSQALGIRAPELRRGSTDQLIRLPAPVSTLRDLGYEIGEPWASLLSYLEPAEQDARNFAIAPAIELGHVLTYRGSFDTTSPEQVACVAVALLGLRSEYKCLSALGVRGASQLQAAIAAAFAPPTEISGNFSPDVLRLSERLWEGMSVADQRRLRDMSKRFDGKIHFEDVLIAWYREAARCSAWAVGDPAWGLKHWLSGDEAGAEQRWQALARISIQEEWLLDLIRWYGSREFAWARYRRGLTGGGSGDR